MSNRERIPHHGGVCAEANAVANLLRACEVRAVGTSNANAEVSEACVFGLGGGLGAGFELKSLRTEHGWSSGVIFHGRGSTGFEFVLNVIQRLGIDATVTSGREIASLPALVEVHPCFLPHLALPPQNAAMWTDYALIVYAIDPSRGTAEIGDLGEGTFEIALADLERAREQAPGGARRMLTLARGTVGKRALSDTLPDALCTCSEGLSKSVDTKHSFQAWHDLAAQMTDSTQRSGWARLPGGKLYVVFSDLYAGIEVLPGGGFHRPLFADFLDEASVLLGDKRLSGVAKTYRKLGDDWTVFADTALPTIYSQCVETKQLWRQRVNVFRRQGVDYLPKVKQHADRLRELARMAATDFTLSSAESTKLLAVLSQQLTSLSEQERAAADRLAGCLAT
jgi:hypothetical protein